MGMVDARPPDFHSEPIWSVALYVELRIQHHMNRHTRRSRHADFFSLQYARYLQVADGA